MINKTINNNLNIVHTKKNEDEEKIRENKIFVEVAFQFLAYANEETYQKWKEKYYQQNKYNSMESN
jgi:hypothetical protein